MLQSVDCSAGTMKGCVGGGPKEICSLPPAVVEVGCCVVELPNVVF